jgi:hypothetical protein
MSTQHRGRFLLTPEARRERVYHYVSREHLARYCDEFAFRYQNRKVSDSERAKMLVLKAEGKRLTYKQPARISA